MSHKTLPPHREGSIKSLLSFSFRLQKASHSDVSSFREEMVVTGNYVRAIERMSDTIPIVWWDWLWYGGVQTSVVLMQTYSASHHGRLYFLLWTPCTICVCVVSSYISLHKLHIVGNECHLAQCFLHTKNLSQSVIHT